MVLWRESRNKRRSERDKTGLTSNAREKVGLVGGGERMGRGRSREGMWVHGSHRVTVFTAKC